MASRRSITPPTITKRDNEYWKTKINPELSILMDSFNDFSKEVQKRVEATLRTILVTSEKKSEELREERDYFKSYAERSVCNESLYRARAKALQLQLNGRGLIDHKEEEIIPMWVRNLTISRSQKWHITIAFQLTHEAKLLALELKILKLDPAIFASKLDRLYHKWGKGHHAKNLDVPQEESEWNELFQELEVTDRLEKRSIRALLSYKETPEEDRVLRSQDVEDVENDSRGYLIIKNIAWKTKNAEIIRFIQSQNVTVYGINHLMTNATEHVPMQTAGIIVIFVDNIENVDFVKRIPSKYCAPMKTAELVEKIAVYEV